MFVGLSEKPDYFKDKVSLFVALGPVSQISHTQADVFRLILPFYDEIANTAWLFGVHEILGANWLTNTATRLFCKNITWFCELIIGIATSSDPALDDNDRYAVYMSHSPNGSSLDAILHYAQNIKEKRFQVWSDDYTDVIGRSKKRTTDLIPLENIQEVPVAIFAGIEDTLADTVDAEWTRDQIGDNVVHYEEIHAGHLSFLVGKNMTYFTETVMDLVQ